MYATGYSLETNIVMNTGGVPMFSFFIISNVSEGYHDAENYRSMVYIHIF